MSIEIRSWLWAIAIWIVGLFWIFKIIDVRIFSNETAEILSDGSLYIVLVCYSLSLYWIKDWIEGWLSELDGKE